MKFNKADTCSQEFKKMEKVSPGIRHCKECKKNVHDFRYKSVQWISDYIEKNGKPCAVYFEDQVDELNAMHEANETRNFSLLKAAAVTGLISVTSMSVQAEPLPIIKEIHEIVRPSSEELIEIKLEDKNGNALTGKKVKLVLDKNKSVELVSGKDGKVSYKLNPETKISSYSVELVETGEIKTYNISINQSQTQAHCVKFASEKLEVAVLKQKIKGRVELTDKNPVTYAAVRLFVRSDSSHVEIGRALTDDEGNFSFEIPAGKYSADEMYVSTASGMGTASENVQAKHIDSKHSKVVLKVTRRVRRSMGGALSF